jgi:hypothetical protein
MLATRLAAPRSRPSTRQGGRRQTPRRAAGLAGPDRRQATTGNNASDAAATHRAITSLAQQQPSGAAFLAKTLRFVSASPSCRKPPKKLEQAFRGSGCDSILTGIRYCFAP